MGINRGSFSSIGTLFVSLFFFNFLSFICFIQLKELRMKMIILIGLLLSVITVEPRSIQREKAAGNAEQRARQLDQGPATFESRDKNAEEQVLEKTLRIRQAGCGTITQWYCNAGKQWACEECGKFRKRDVIAMQKINEQRARQLDQGTATFESRDKNAEEQVLEKMLRIRQAGCGTITQMYCNAGKQWACEECGKFQKRDVIAMQKINEQRARQLDQGTATFESRDKNAEEQVLEKMLRIRQAGC